MYSIFSYTSIGPKFHPHLQGLLQFKFPHVSTPGSFSKPTCTRDMFQYRTQNEEFHTPCQSPIGILTKEVDVFQSGNTAAAFMLTNYAFDYYSIKGRNMSRRIKGKKELCQPLIIPAEAYYTAKDVV